MNVITLYLLIFFLQETSQSVGCYSNVIAGCVTSFDCMEILVAHSVSTEHLDVLSQVTMDLLQDSTHTMRGLNTRLRGFLEQVNRLQEANQQLEAQIANWGIRSTLRSHDWSQQEQTVSVLHAQVRYSCLVICLSVITQTIKNSYKLYSCLLN